MKDALRDDGYEACVDIIAFAHFEKMFSGREILKIEEQGLSFK